MHNNCELFFKFSFKVEFRVTTYRNNIYTQHFELIGIFEISLAIPLIKYSYIITLQFDKLLAYNSISCTCPLSENTIFSIFVRNLSPQLGFLSKNLK